jgi:ubiquinone/menaquinone biosynthesis C-methylase UbiE
VNISYDTIAADYAIHRNVQPNLLRKLIEFPRIASSSRVLEVGCGTGNYISSIASLTSAKCFGIEPSSGMLEEARKKAAPISWSQGTAEALPYPDGSFDFIFSADVIHHVRDRLAFFKEAFRVLAHGGWFATATDSEKTIRRRMPLSHYFPETIDPELCRYPKEHEIQQLLASQGFDRISDELIEFAYSLSDSVPFERKAFSCLHLISEDAFARGFKRLKQDLEAGPIPCISRCVIYWGHKS